MTAARITLCALGDLADPGARGFVLETDAGRLDLVVVRTGTAVRAYVNSCPHQGTPLETFPDRFLTADGTELLCTTHGARFRLDDGVCVSGPCKGKALKPLGLVVADGAVHLAAAPALHAASHTKV